MIFTGIAAAFLVFALIDVLAGAYQQGHFPRLIERAASFIPSRSTSAPESETNIDTLIKNSDP